MTYSDIKQIREFCAGLDSSPDWREVTIEISENVDDFFVDGVRFIHASEIDEILSEELSSDLYVLGCFNAGFLAGVTGIDYEAIKAIQDAEAFEACGKLVLPYVNEIAERYACADGYGHHFNSYDFGEEELMSYKVFDNR